MSEDLSLYMPRLKLVGEVDVMCNDNQHKNAPMGQGKVTGFKGLALRVYQRPYLITSSFFVEQTYQSSSPKCLPCSPYD